MQKYPKNLVESLELFVDNSNYTNNESHYEELELLLDVIKADINCQIYKICKN